MITESLILCSVLNLTSVCFLGPLPPTLRLLCSTIISLPVPPLTAPRISFPSFQICTRHFYWDMMFDYPTNNYPVYFNLEASQINLLYLRLHFLDSSAILNTLKSNF